MEKLPIRVVTHTTTGQYRNKERGVSNMKAKPRLIIASVILLAAIVMRAFGINTFIEAIGYMAAGFLFGTIPQAKE